MNIALPPFRRCVLSVLTSVVLSAGLFAQVDSPFVTSTVLGSLRNNFSGWVGMQFVVGPLPLTVSQLGRIVAPGNTGTHRLKLMTAGDVKDVPGGAVTISTVGRPAGQFQYCSLSSPVKLAANTTYWLLSEETWQGDGWYDWDTTVTTTSAAVNSGFAWSTGPDTWASYPVANRGPIPVNFIYTVPTMEYVTSTVLGTLRNDFPEYINFNGATATSYILMGMRIRVGALPLYVSELGRMMAPGNSGTHLVSLYEAPNLSLIGQPVAAVDVSMSGGTPGLFQYATLSYPFMLKANTTYYLMSREKSGEDRWYDSDTTVTTTGAAIENGFIATIYPWHPGATPVSNRSFGPVNFRYTLNPAGANSSFVTQTGLGTLRNEFTGWVGMQFRVYDSITVLQLGRMACHGNTGVHTLKLVKASDGLDVPGGAVTIATTGSREGLFQYGILNSPVTLEGDTTYWLLSQETAGGDHWYNWDTGVSTTGVAINTGFVSGTGPGNWSVLNVINRGAGPLNFKY